MSSNNGSLPKLSRSRSPGEGAAECHRTPFGRRNRFGRPSKIGRYGASEADLAASRTRPRSGADRRLCALGGSKHRPPRDSHECGGAGGNGHEAMSHIHDFRTGSPRVRCGRAAHPSQDRAATPSLRAPRGRWRRCRPRCGGARLVALWRLPDRSRRWPQCCVPVLMYSVSAWRAGQRSVGDMADDGCCCGWRCSSSSVGVSGASGGS